MDGETIVAIITAGIAFLTSAATLTYTLVQSKKDRIQKVILDNRVKYLNAIREGFAKFIGLANTEAVKFAKSNKEVMKIYSDNLFVGYGKIKTYIKPFYKIDNELLIALDKLYNCVLSVLNGAEEAQNSIDGLRENFADKYLKYDWAYWKYIQSQKDGNYINSDDAFDNVYCEFIKDLESKSL